MRKRVMIDCNTCNTENFGITTPPQEWACKAYALTQFSELSMVMEYETLDDSVPPRIQ